ncbi:MULTISPECIES: sugar phosphate isomerase/epimerase [unclassified Sporosarcina]|uniref:sugar phosphate isomerase/epimerase family protein n=1 Tax=unclassified Sporosarcina TaxID=2647733 RepID=UPI00203CDFC5|nr:MULTISPECIES: sugar phosphate isomerase/epimerase [unclassified Sporosarcina]GKV65107.1 hypothetical protein NCCP2331_12600 [Sporosarcina sp. NCCP-2331]GLB55231.1 hypothetical protein NCCP2378_10170 [Sporosarcina sp. NCCP-2378]
MKLGVSIQSTGLRRDAGLEERKKYLAGFKDLQEYLKFLKSNGINSIEIRKYKVQDAFEDFQKAVEAIWEKDMEITIHGEVAGSPSSGKWFSDFYPSLLPILEQFGSYQPKLIIPIHAYQSTSLETSVLKEDTINLFNKWISFIQSEELNVNFALENNRQKSVNDPCDHLEGVLEIVNEVNSPHLGICWDMGHYRSNLTHDLKDSKNGNVQDAFFDKVVHTHIHGLNEQRVTHFPIGDHGSLPLEEYVSALKRVDYNGVYNLEFSFGRWAEEVDVQRELSRSIERLNHAVEA